MSRGPRPARAQDESLPIAGKRGLVMRYQHRRGTICDFSLMSPGLVSFVCVKRLIRLSSTPEDILHDFSTVIGQLRFIASSPAISRELWLRTPRGAWRFFRVLDDSLRELDRDGMPLANGTGPAALPAAVTGRIQTPGLFGKKGKKAETDSRPSAGKDADPVKKSAPAVPAKDPGQPEITAMDLPPASAPEPEKDPKPAAIPATIAEPVNDPSMAEDRMPLQEEEKIPDPIRKFLRRRNKGRENDHGAD